MPWKSSLAKGDPYSSSATITFREVLLQFDLRNAHTDARAQIAGRAKLFRTADSRTHARTHALRYCTARTNVDRDRTSGQRETQSGVVFRPDSGTRSSQISAQRTRSPKAFEGIWRECSRIDELSFTAVGCFDPSLRRSWRGVASTPLEETERAFRCLWGFTIGKHRNHQGR